jgi:2-C-methyl-D-erythritol 4-phosphate cytidylyltransferase
MANKRKVWAVVPAAGISLRMGTGLPKQYQIVSGLPILHHTLARLCSSPSITGVVAGINSNDKSWNENPFIHVKMLGKYTGGEERADTVLAGLEFLTAQGASETDWALVHDAARPCIMQQDIANLVEAAEFSQQGAVLGSTVSDTLKMTGDETRIESTINRSGLWRAFTPQIFPLSELANALEHARKQGISVTDESMAMEILGTHATMVQGHNSNIKITIPADLDLAEIYLREFP